MQNNFSKCREWVPRGTSQHKWRWLTTLLLILTLGIGQMWGAKTTIFSLETKTSGDDVTVAHGGSTTISTSDCLSSLTGATSVTLKNKRSGSGSQKMVGTDNNEYHLTFTHNDLCIIIQLTSALEKGDEISLTGGSNNKICFTASETRSTSDYATTSSAFTIPENHALIGKSTLYIWRNSGNTYIKTLTISRTTSGCTSPSDPEITADPTNATYTAGGTISLTASATGTTASTKYTWYKGNTWDLASAADPVQAESTSGATYTKATCTTDDTGTYWCKISNGSTCEVTASKAVTVNASETPVCPSGLTISGTTAYTEGQTISLTAALEAGNGTITYQWYKGSVAVGNEISGATAATYSKASCVTGDAGDYFCVASKSECSDAVNVSAYAITVAAAPASCYAYTAPTDQTTIFHVGDVIPGSTGGQLTVYSEATNSDSSPKNSIKFDNANGLKLGGGAADRVQITLSNMMQVGTVISVAVTSGSNSNPDGLYLKNESNGNVKDSGNQNVLFGWSTAPEQGTQATFTYTVRASDGLEGKNVFILERKNTVYIRSISVSNCGAELHALTSAIDPVAADGKATITLSKSLVAAGGTATATYSAIDPAYDFDEWQISGATIDDAKANPVTITMGSTDATITLKLKAAAVKHTVTYYDGETELGSELVNEGTNPTGAGLAPRKLGFTFTGWSTTTTGEAAGLNTISVAADMPLYAVWSAVNCSAQSGTIYTMSIDVAPLANCTITSTTGTHDLYQYGGVSGGEAIMGNKGTSNNCILTTDKTIILKDDNSYLKLDFDCPLKEGDKIVYNVSGNNPFVSIATSRPSESAALAVLNRSKTEFVIPAANGLIDAQTIYVWKGGGNTTITSINIYRSAHYAVTFNMHGHGDQVAQQDILEGGKVTEPATTNITGWDFGGWYKEDTYENEWDFDNDVVSAVTELHAKWTAHVASNDVALGTLSVNGEAITIVPSQTVYAVELPMGTTDIPTVVATANDVNAMACTVTQATAVDGSASIYVKAEDDATEATYTINFSVATSKDIELVWDKSKQRCDATTPDAVVKSDDATVSTYINKMTFTGGGEGSSLNVGNTAGNMVTLTAKPGYAISAMSFYGKIEADDAKLEYSLNGGAWTDLASTNAGDACYADVFTAAEVHELRMRSAGNKGFWIRNMQLTVVEACTPITIAWDEEPVEFEVGKSGYAIAATANNGGTVAYSSTDDAIVDVVAATGELTISGLGSATLKAATAEGDGSTYCANAGADIEISKVVNTYYLVKFDAQNGDAVAEHKYYSGDAAIALPADPTFAGYDFQGWFDAETGGNKYTAAITPTASTTVYAQWVAQCAGATITTQPTGASYLTGRTPVALVCEATAGNGGALTYEWFTCDDEMRTNPVAATATPSTAVAGTYYYFCKVTEEGCAVEAFSNVVTITIADKDAICIIKSIPTSGTEATVDGVYQGNAFFTGREVDKKLNSKYHNIGVQLKEGYTFLATDRVVLNQTVALGSGDLSKFYVFYEVPADGKTYATVLNASPVQGDNWFDMPAEIVGKSSLYVGRVDANCNPSVGYLAVYRASAPILSKITVNSVEGTPDNTNHVTIEVPASTTQGQLEAIAYEWVSNSDAWTVAHDPAAANAWEFGVENTVTFTDKDGDASEYYITVNKAAASSDATLSALTVNGQAIALADGVFDYSFELPYGTTAVPTVVATAHHAGAVATVDPCTLSGATITVVPESGAGDQQVYTLTFTISAWKEVAIFDGSYMTALATSPTDEKELRWEVYGFDGVAKFEYQKSYGEAYCSNNDKTYSVENASNKYEYYQIKSGGTTKNSRYFKISVPKDYVAQFYVVYGSHSQGTEAKMYVDTEYGNQSPTDQYLLLSTSNRYQLTGGMSEIVGAGDYYLNATSSVDFAEVRVYMRPGYARTDMLGNGVLGTVCVPNNVAVEDIQGVTVYELMGREPQYGKIAFDEIVSGELEAGVPYVFQANGDKMVMFYGETKVDDPVDKGNGMYGTFVDQTLTNLDDVYYFAQRALWSCVDLTSLNLPANRAYVKLSEIGEVPSANPAPGRRRITMTVNGEKVATDVENLNASEAPVKLIIDGKMYILRGEKLFDATGRLVK